MAIDLGNTQRSVNGAVVVCRRQVGAVSTHLSTEQPQLQLTRPSLLQVVQGARCRRLRCPAGRWHANRMLRWRRQRNVAVHMWPAAAAAANWLCQLCVCQLHSRHLFTVTLVIITQSVCNVTWKTLTKLTTETITLSTHEQLGVVNRLHSLLPIGMCGIVILFLFGFGSFWMSLVRFGSVWKNSVRFGYY